MKFVRRSMCLNASQIKDIHIKENFNKVYRNIHYFSTSCAKIDFVNDVRLVIATGDR